MKFACSLISDKVMQLKEDFISKYKLFVHLPKFSYSAFGAQELVDIRYNYFLKKHCLFYYRDTINK